MVNLMCIFAVFHNLDAIHTVISQSTESKRTNGMSVIDFVYRQRRKLRCPPCPQIECTDPVVSSWHIELVNKLKLNLQI